jgi:transcriptional regulator with XRE-family HTH domain
MDLMAGHRVSQDGPSGGLLRKARLDVGLSQEALARRAGCSVKTVYRLESGYEPARSVAREALAAVLLDLARAKRDQA